MEKLVNDKEESHQRCAAEIISGIIRGAKHWEYDKTVRLWSKLVPLIETAIVNLYSETKTDWAICFSMALESRDSTRCHWLVEYLMDDPLKDPTSFTACERLRLLTTAVGQQSWRNTELCHRIINYIRPHLAHRFQNIREKISSCLAVVLREDTILQLGNTKESTKTLDFFKEVFPKLNVLYTNALVKFENTNKNNGDDNKMDCDSTSISDEVENEENQSAIRLFKVGEYQDVQSTLFYFMGGEIKIM